MKINPINLEKKLKLKFSDQKIFIKSLTHKSFDSKDNNEKNHKDIKEDSVHSFCPSCGKQILIQGNFCSQCGNKLI